MTEERGKKRKNDTVDKQKDSGDEKLRRLDHDESRSFMENMQLSARRMAQLKEFLVTDESLKKDSENILRKLRFFRSCPGIDINIVPTEVADCLSTDGLVSLAKKIVSNRDNPKEVKNGINETREGESKAWIEANADIIPPEVACAMGKDKRRQIAAKIRELRQGKSAARSHDAKEPIGKEDEAFIKENLHLGKLSYTDPNLFQLVKSSKYFLKY